MTAGQEWEEDLRVKHQGTYNIADRVRDKSNSSVYRLLGMTGYVGRTKTNTLRPGRGEEVNQVESDNATGTG